MTDLADKLESLKLHFKLLVRLADELHDGTPEGSGRSADARGAAHALGNALPDIIAALRELERTRDDAELGARLRKLDEGSGGNFAIHGSSVLGHAVYTSTFYGYGIGEGTTLLEALEKTSEEKP